MIGKISKLLLVCCAFASWIGSASAAELVIGLATEIGSMDPHNRYQISELALHRHIFDPLVIQDEKQQLSPGLATSWKAIDDKTWEFKLRDNVKFHDGSAFDAEDVRATIDRVPRVKTTGGYSLFTKQIKKMTIVDPLTIRFETDAPYPLMPRDLSQVQIIPKEVAETAEIADFNSGKAAIGTGTYKLESWTRGDRIVMNRNDDFWGKKPEWTSLVFRMITNRAARVAALLAGDVQIIEAVPTTAVAPLKRNPDVSIWSGVTNRSIYLYIDQRDQTPHVTDKNGNPLSKNPLQDIRVREAISKAIDRKAIVETVMEGYAVAAGQVLPEGFFGYSEKLKPDVYDPEKARQLLSAAGYPDGFRLKIHGPNDRYINDAKIVLAIAQMLAKVGIKTEVETMPKNVFFTRASKLEFSVNLQGWGATGEASSVLRAILVTYDRDAGMGIYNIGRYSNLEVDSLVEKALVEVNDEKREDLLKKATEIAMADYALIPLHFQVGTWATKKGLEYTPRTDEQTLGVGVISGS